MRTNVVRIGLVHSRPARTYLVRSGWWIRYAGHESCAKSAISEAGCRIIVGIDPAL